MVINRIYIWIYFKLRKDHNNYEEIIPEGHERVLVLAPHVDDETIGLGGTIIKYTNKRCKLDLVYLTDGSGSTSHKSKEETARERMEEGYKVKEEYGFNNVYFLEKVDGTLNSNDEELISELVSILQREKPNTIFSPFLIDGNIDHIETTKALSKALEIWNENFEGIYLYQVNTLIDAEIVNAISPLDKRTYEEKLEKFNIFKSQWAMGFSVFNLLDRGRAIKCGNSHAVEEFARVNSQSLEKIVEKLEKENFNPQLFKQISSEFTLILTFMKSRKDKMFYNKLVKETIENKKLGGSSYRAN